MNKVIIRGYIGKDPDVYRGTNGDNAYVITRFSVATNRKLYINGQKVIDPATGKQKEETTWHRVKTSGKLGETCAAHLCKGRNVLVEGRIKKSTYMGDAVDANGNKVCYPDGSVVQVQLQGVEVVAREVEFLDKKPQQNAYNGQQAQAYTQQNVQPQYAQPAPVQQQAAPVAQTAPVQHQAAPVYQVNTPPPAAPVDPLASI